MKIQLLFGPDQKHTLLHDLLIFVKRVNQRMYSPTGTVPWEERVGEGTDPLGQNYTATNYMALHYTTLQYTALHYTTLHDTTLLCTLLYSTTIH